MSLNLKPGGAPAGLTPRIAVVGIGGAGCNAVDHMIEAGLEGVSFFAANTDAQALGRARCPNRVQLGRRVTSGLGAGSDPEVGRAAAEEALEEVLDAIDDSHLVFIAAGMGGGTGTGGAPVIARAAQEAGLLTVGVVTKPFAFEGPRRMRTAEAGLQELERHLDTLLVIANQNLFQVADARTTFAEAFRLADGVLEDGIRSITDLIVRPGLINLDFADVRTVIEGMGRAVMGAGEAEGEDRAIAAAEAAITNPLLEGLALSDVREVLINVTGGEDLLLHEIEAAVDHVKAKVHPEADLIFGSALDPSLGGRMRISLVATGLYPAAALAPAGAARGAKLSLVSNRDEARAALLGETEDGKPPETPAEPAVVPAQDEAPRDESPEDEAAESAAPDPGASEAVDDEPGELGEPAETKETSPADAGAGPAGAGDGEPGVIGRLVTSLIADPEVLYRKAERYYHGHGVDKDLRAAFRLYRKAARRGHASAQNRLGWMLERGEGVEVDAAAAAQWHRRAAQQGHLNAMNDLGYLYRQGRGVPRDFGQALYWFRLAAARHYSYAEFNLGQMYENGWGVPRDLGEAVRWYRRAAGRRHEWAGRRLKDLGVAL